MATVVQHGIRLREPRRDGVVVTVALSDDLLAPTHAARLLWDYFGTCDLAPFLARARARVGRGGRPVTSPRLLLALWGYGLSRGLTHATQLAALADTGDLGARWLLGDVPRVCHDVLSDFLVDHRAALSGLLTDGVTHLIARGALRVPLAEVAVDGVRVRADAAPSAFRTAATLADHRAWAATHVQALLAAYDAAAPGAAAALGRGCAWAARVVAAEQAAAAVGAARAQAPDKRRAARPARAATTDPDARLMRLATGAIAPAYNVQLAVAGAAAGGPRTIVGVCVTQAGNDRGGVLPLVDDAT